MSDRRDLDEEYMAEPRRKAGFTGGLTIDPLAEMGKARARVQQLEEAANLLVEAQDAELRPDGSISCLRFVNTEALKTLMFVLRDPKMEKPIAVRPFWARTIRDFFKCDPTRTPEEDKRISDRALDVVREGHEDTLEFELALDVLIIRGEVTRLRERLAELERRA